MDTLRARLQILFTCFALLIGCSKEEPGPQQLQTPGDVVIVVTNDFHAALDRAEGMASVIRDVRKKYPERVVYLDAGDQFQGSVEGNISKGEAVVELFNLLELDAAAVGNHELDYGPNVTGRVTVKAGEEGMGNLLDRAKKAKYAWISANLIFDPVVPCDPGPQCNALGEMTVLKPRHILRRADAKVCVIGATTPTTENITNPDFLKGKAFGALKPVILAEAKMLRERELCDFVILLIHEGLRYGLDGKTYRNVGLMPLLRELPSSSVDLVVGGHSHIQVQQVINGLPVIQTGTGAKAVGVVHLSRNGGHVTHVFEPLIPVPDTAVAFDVTRMLSRFRQVAFQYKRQVIGTAAAPFPQDKVSESALGNMMADAVLQAAKQRDKRVQFSIMNSGGIRSALPQGKITYDHVFKLMPFSNWLVVVQMTGAELRRLLEVAFSGALGTPSISGFRVISRRPLPSQAGPWDRDLNGDGVKEEWERDLLLNVTDAKGNTIALDKNYWIATNSFLAEGGDYQDVVYDKIPLSRIHDYEDLLIRDILVEYCRANSPLQPNKYLTSATSRVKTVQIETQAEAAD